jgi:hypothetical protein
MLSPALSSETCTYLNVRDKASHPCRTIGKITVPHFLIFTVLDSRRICSALNCNKRYQNSISSSFPPESEFYFLLSFTNISTVQQFWRVCLYVVILPGIPKWNENPQSRQLRLRQNIAPYLHCHEIENFLAMWPELQVRSLSTAINLQLCCV